MITVVGSVNVDVVAKVEHHPRPGETLIASGHHVAHGGKGANQAVAAARLGAPVEFVGCVGDDEQGRGLRDGLRQEGVGVTHLRSVGAPSGLALIVVDERGENTIVVASGANAQVRVSRDNLRTIVDGAVVMMQLEIPMATVVEAAGAATGLVILNAAPAHPLPDPIWGNIDVLVVNEHELEASVGDATQSVVRDRGLRALITTLGADGARVVTPGDIAHIPAPQVVVRDTTGAGDAFCGALAASLHAGMDVFASAARAVHAGALATTRVGAREAMPTADELTQEMRGA